MAIDDGYRPGLEVRDAAVVQTVGRSAFWRQHGMARNTTRRGAAIIEFAVVAPLLFLLLLGIFEVGRVIMVQQTLSNSAREGARQGVLPDATAAQVYSTIDSCMSSSGLTGHARQVSPSPGSAVAGDPITVTVSIPYNSVSWLPLRSLRWLEGQTLSAAVDMRKEEY